MKKDRIMENHEFQMYWISHANPEMVFEWLKEQKLIFRYSSSREEIEKVLIERHEPLINLGLALYVELSGETALRLFRNGDRTIKKAVLAGPSIEEGLDSRAGPLSPAGALYEDFKEILDFFDQELLESALSNGSIPDHLLVSLYKKQEPFANLTDEQWLRAIWCTTSNPRLGTPYDGLMGSSGHYRHYKVFTAGWKLFETLPVNEVSALLLFHLGKSLLPYQPHDMDVHATIKRWEKQDDAHFAGCRSALAGLIPVSPELKNSDDIALRESYYSRFTTSNPEEIKELYEKDYDKFVEVAIYNPSLYRNGEVREALSECCWNCNLSSTFGLWYANAFKAQEERLTEEHPEWFVDFDEDIPFNAVKDPVMRANSRLEFLQKQIKIISQNLIGDEVKIALDQLQSDLAKYCGWLAIGGLLIGSLIGYLLSKWW